MVQIFYNCILCRRFMMIPSTLDPPHSTTPYLFYRHRQNYRNCNYRNFLPGQWENTLAKTILPFFSVACCQGITFVDHLFLFFTILSATVCSLQNKWHLPGCAFPTGNSFSNPRFSGAMLVWRCKVKESSKTNWIFLEHNFHWWITSTVVHLWYGNLRIWSAIRASRIPPQHNILVRTTRNRTTPKATQRLKCNKASLVFQVLSLSHFAGTNPFELSERVIFCLLSERNQKLKMYRCTIYIYTHVICIHVSSKWRFEKKQTCCSSDVVCTTDDWA